MIEPFYEHLSNVFALSLYVVESLVLVLDGGQVLMFFRYYTFRFFGVFLSLFVAMSSNTALATEQTGLYVTNSFIYSIPVTRAFKSGDVLVVNRQHDVPLKLTVRDNALLSPSPKESFGIGYQVNPEVSIDETANYLYGQSIDIVWKGKMFNSDGIYTMHSMSASLLFMTNINWTPKIYHMHDGGNWSPLFGFGLGIARNHLDSIHYQPAGPTEYYRTKAQMALAWHGTVGAEFYMNKALSFLTSIRLSSQGRQAKGSVPKESHASLVDLSGFRTHTPVNIELCFGFQYHI